MWNGESERGGNFPPDEELTPIDFIHRAKEEIPKVGTELVRLAGETRKVSCDMGCFRTGEIFTGLWFWAAEETPGVSHNDLIRPREIVSKDFSDEIPEGLDTYLIETKSLAQPVLLRCSPITPRGNCQIVPLVSEIRTLKERLQEIVRNLWRVRWLTCHDSRDQDNIILEQISLGEEILRDASHLITITENQGFTWNILPSLLGRESKLAWQQPGSPYEKVYLESGFCEALQKGLKTDLEHFLRSYGYRNLSELIIRKPQIGHVDLRHTLLRKGQRRESLNLEREGGEFNPSHEQPERPEIEGTAEPGGSKLSSGPRNPSPEQCESGPSKSLDRHYHRGEPYRGRHSSITRSLVGENSSQSLGEVWKGARPRKRESPDSDRPIRRGPFMLVLSPSEARQRGVRWQYIPWKISNPLYQICRDKKLSRPLENTKLLFYIGNWVSYVRGLKQEITTHYPPFLNCLVCNGIEEFQGQKQAILKGVRYLEEHLKFFHDIPIHLCLALARGFERRPRERKMKGVSSKGGISLDERRTIDDMRRLSLTNCDTDVQGSALPPEVASGPPESETRDGMSPDKKEREIQKPVSLVHKDYESDSEMNNTEIPYENLGYPGLAQAPEKSLGRDQTANTAPPNLLDKHLTNVSKVGNETLSLLRENNERDEMGTLAYPEGQMSEDMPREQGGQPGANSPTISMEVEEGELVRETGADEAAVGNERTENDLPTIEDFDRLLSENDKRTGSDDDGLSRKGHMGSAIHTPLPDNDDIDLTCQEELVDSDVSQS